MKPIDLDTVLAEERRIMDEFAPIYDAAIRTNSYVYRLARERFVKWMARIIAETGERAAMSVLDAGCATGSVLELLSREGFGRLTGLDLSLRMLEVARRRELPRTLLVQGTIEEAPFQERTFDVIVASFTVHHLFDPGAFFRLVDRTLRPGGFFFIQDYDDDSGIVGESGGGTRRSVGDLVRKVLAWKNRRVLASKPDLRVQFNSAHQPMNFAGMCRAISDPDSYDVRQRSHGFILPALLPVLVEESALDRRIVQVADAIDGRLERRRPGLFQWIAGHRRS